MDPLNPESFNHRSAELATGHTYQFVDQTPEGFDPSRTKTILCVHGFPDLWYGWRYQIAPWVQAGYRVVVPTMLGYGGTDKPADVVNYSTKRLSEDLSALLDFVGVRKAIVIGHDWGAAIVWKFAAYFPERVQVLVALSIPYTPPSPTYAPLSDVVRRFLNFGYQLYFENSQSTEEIDNNIGLFLDMLFRLSTNKSIHSIVRQGEIQNILLNNNERVQSIDGRLLTSREREYYLQQFSKGGMHGPLSYYRTTRHRFEEEKDAKLPTGLPGDFPVLFFYGTKDPSCSQKAAGNVKKFVKDLKVVELEGLGHWLMVEGKDIITQEVLRFLKERLPCTKGVSSKL